MTMRAAVTSAVPTVGLAGGAIQTAAYTWAAGDLGNCLILNPASAISQALPTPTGSSGNFANGWNASVENVSGNVVTLTVPAGVSLDGVSNGSVTLYPNTGCRFFTDGTNWYTTRGLSNGGGVGLKAPGVLYTSSAASTLTGTTSQTVMATVVIPANAIADGGKLEVDGIVSANTSPAGTRQFTLALNGISCLTTTLATTAFGSFPYMEFYRRGTSMVHATSIVPATSITAGLQTRAVDPTQAITLTMLMQLANAADSITLDAMTVKVLNK
ncbi:hypothetical protein [Cupriavidus malaysiensis]|nr:hypothetical protein [Cupriavidus malaysiensis]